MKTFDKKFHDLIDMTDGSVVINEQVYKQIQLDAFKAGMTKTISIMLQDEEMYEHPINVEIVKSLKDEIVKARDNLKEI